MINSKSDDKNFGFHEVRALRSLHAVLGLVLIAGGALKFYDIASAEQEDGLGTLIFMVLYEAEIFAGLWLVWGAYPERTRPWAVAVFTGFWVSGLYRVITGSCSCGCFGIYSVNPWYVLLFDTVVVAVLLKWRPSGEKRAEWPSDTPSRAGITLTALVIASAGIGQHTMVAVAGKATRRDRPLADALLVLRGRSLELHVRTDLQGYFRLPPVRPGQYSLSIRDPSAILGSKAEAPERVPLKTELKKSRRRSERDRGRMGPQEPKGPTSELAKQYADVQIVPLEVDECSAGPLAIDFK